MPVETARPPAAAAMSTSGCHLLGRPRLDSDRRGSFAAAGQQLFDMRVTHPGISLPALMPFPDCCMFAPIRAPLLRPAEARVRLHESRRPADKAILKDREDAAEWHPIDRLGAARPRHDPRRCNTLPN